MERLFEFARKHDLEISIRYDVVTNSYIIQTRKEESGQIKRYCISIPVDHIILAYDMRHIEEYVFNTIVAGMGLNNE